jgi:hypothetical protein
MDKEILVAVLSLIGGITVALIGAVATIYGSGMMPLLKKRRRQLGGRWVGTASEIEALDSTADHLARYTVAFDLKQTRSRVTGKINASSDDGNVFHDRLEGRLTTEQDLCFTFAAADENVHDFGAAIFHIHPNGREMTGYVLSNESSSAAGRVFIMRASMTRSA